MDFEFRATACCCWCNYYYYYYYYYSCYYYYYYHYHYGGYYCCYCCCCYSCYNEYFSSSIGLASCSYKCESFGFHTFRQVLPIVDLVVGLLESPGRFSSKCSGLSLPQAPDPHAHLTKLACSGPRMEGWVQFNMTHPPLAPRSRAAVFQLGGCNSPPSQTYLFMCLCTVYNISPT